MTPPTRRPHPPDRRAPVPVKAGQCPARRMCGCCVGPFGFGHFNPNEPDPRKRPIRNCPMTHPATDRRCKLPYPSEYPPCPERAYWSQDSQPGQVFTDRSCVECGLGTARAYTGDALPWAEGQALPWCGGVLAGEGDTPVPAPVVAAVERAAVGSSAPLVWIGATLVHGTPITTADAYPHIHGKEIEGTMTGRKVRVRHDDCAACADGKARA